MLKRLSAVALICVAGSQALAGASTYVVPQAYTDTPGTASFIGPMANGQRTNQYLIHENLLTGLVGKQLNGISWRLGSGSSSDYPTQDISFANYDIYLSGSVDPSERSSTFAENVVGEQMQVRSGSLDVPAASFTSGGSPNEFSFVINFDGYIYTGGNLLVEVRHTGSGSTSRALDAISTSTAGYGELFSALWKSDYNAVDDGLQGNFVIPQFSYSEIPAPGAVGLFGLAGLAAVRRRR
ncbi:MAG: hypothetical protein ACIAQF_11665 [Phycisphaerales bacterium JB065]